MSDKIKNQVLNKAEKMIKWLEGQISDNQAAIKSAEVRINVAHAEIERSKKEIEMRVKTISDFSQDKAEWLEQKNELEKL